MKLLDWPGLSDRLVDFGSCLLLDVVEQVDDDEEMDEGEVVEYMLV